MTFADDKTELSMPQATTSPHNVYTLGYIGTNPVDIISFLNAHNAMLIDVRYMNNPSAIVWKHQTMMINFNYRYRHIRELGDKNYNGKMGEGIMIADMDRGISLLMETATEFPVVLLCECADYHTCHRNVVADELVKRYGLHVTHLSSSQLLQKPLTVELPLRQC